MTHKVALALGTMGELNEGFVGEATLLGTGGELGLGELVTETKGGGRQFGWLRHEAETNRLVQERSREEDEILTLIITDEDL